MCLATTQFTRRSPRTSLCRYAPCVSRAVLAYTDPPIWRRFDLAVSTRTVRRYNSDGQLEAVRFGRKTLRLKVDSIERFIDARPVGNWRWVSKGSTTAGARAGSDQTGLFLVPHMFPETERDPRKGL